MYRYLLAGRDCGGQLPCRLSVCLAMILTILCLDATAQTKPDTSSFDVVVYGATPAGIAAAISAARDECSVLLVEPTRRIGGLVTNGLSHTDYRTREGLNGLFLEFAHRVEQFYIDSYGKDSAQAKSCELGTFGEPKVNLKIFEQMISEQKKITVLKDHRLVKVDLLRNSSTALNTIRSLTFTTTNAQARTVQCRLAIDGTYEGDLMAMSGVAWRAGREAKTEYNESLAPEKADNQLQAYNFRFTMTDVAANRVTPSAPRNYKREDFEGVLTALKSGKIKKIFGYPSACIFKAQTPALPNDKYDINDVSRNLVRLSLPGKNLDWPDGTVEQRRAIFDEHMRDQVGLLYFLQNDPAVPEKFQSEARRWGWCRDEFEETNHLPDQLYVREARRMVGKHVFVQRDSEHAPGDARSVLHRDAIAIGDYGNNCHGTAHEGPRFGGEHTGEFYNSVPPYQIPYLTLVPNEVDNLLVPTAVSSSHVGFCALRLEPIWMSLGQAAGHAAAWALHNQSSVQKVAVRPLQARLHKIGAATIYVSDVPPGHTDYPAVQWWGTLGGLHGLEPMPEKPGQRGKNLHGQYYEAYPSHAVQLDLALDEANAKRWKSIAQIAGLAVGDIPELTPNMTRGDFIRAVFSQAQKKGLLISRASIPRANPKATLNTHAPGDVDDTARVASVVTSAETLEGIVVDDSDAELIGQWHYSTHTPPYVGVGYLHDNYKEKGMKRVRFVPDLPTKGNYEVRISYGSNIRRTPQAKVIVHHASGIATQIVNQQNPGEHSGLFHTVGIFSFDAGTTGLVEISNEGTDGKVVIADAVQFLPRGKN